MLKTYTKGECKMKKQNVLLAIIVLVLASLACQSLSGGGDSGAPEPSLPSNGDGVESQPTANVESSGDTTDVKSDFPLPDGATSVQEINGSTNFQVKMSLDEVMKFYVETFTSSGYTERSILTVTSDTTFSMVFDGHESGKAIVVQGVDLGDGKVNVNVRLEDV
jgi:hypothetical protein